MSADVDLIILDPESGMVVEACWIGGNAVRNRVEEMLARPADHTDLGFLSWGRLTENEVERICEAHYAGGLSSADVQHFALEYPLKRFWWSLCVSY